MAKTPHQKMKVLCLLRILQRRSDEDHPITAGRIIELLAAEGYSAERKSIYNDIQSLIDFGYDIEFVRGKGYYLANREFQLPELRLLVDAVQSSRFITAKKSSQLIAKLEQFASEEQAGSLQRQVRVANRNKALNETIYYNVDSLHAAIAGGKQVKFQYFHYNVQKERVLRRDGAMYEVSPFALVWNNDNYYLVAYDSGSKSIRHYRVDRMLNLSLSPRMREGGDVYRAFELSSYTEAHFGMFSGQEQRVTLRCRNEVVNVLLDRFGHQIMLIPDGEEHFRVTVPVVVSPQFTGWVFGLGDQIEVVAPGNVRRQMQESLAAVMKLYQE